MRIGAYDYRHPGWVGPLYPEDLPPEWMLTYYANEFSAVVLPPSAWRAPATAVWLADTAPAFRFFLDLPPGADPAAAVAVAHALGERCGGVLAQTPLQLPPGVPLGLPPQVAAAGAFAVARSAGPLPPRALRAALERLGPGGLLVVEGKPPSLEVMHAARTLAELLGL